MAKLYDSIEKCVERCKFNIRFSPDFVERAYIAINLFKNPELHSFVNIPSEYNEETCIMHMQNAEIQEVFPANQAVERVRTVNEMLSRIMYI